MEAHRKNELVEETLSIRYAENKIHQPYWRKEAKNWLRVLKNNRLVEIESLEPPQNIEELIRKMPKLDFKYRFPPIDPIKDEKECNLGTENWFKKILNILDTSEKNGYKTWGSFELTIETWKISDGKTEAMQKRCYAKISFLVGKDEAFGWREKLLIDPALEIEEAWQEAATLARASEKKPLDAETIEVLITPQAFSEILYFIAWALNGKNYEEGKSPFSGKLGEKLFPDWFNFYDDPFSPLSIPLKFDFDGVKRKPTAMIENGVLVNMAYDSLTAAKYKKENTACATPFREPFPLNGVVPGKNSEKDFLRNYTGIAINQLHYVNLVDPTSFTLTGIIRNGFCYFKKGKPVYHFCERRFLDSVYNIVKHAQPVGEAEAGYPVACPPILTRLKLI